MPKNRRIKRRPKKRAKKVSRGRKKAPAADDRLRGLALAIIDRMGGSVAEQTPERLVIARFNAHPFVINLRTWEVEDVAPMKPVEVSVPIAASP